MRSPAKVFLTLAAMMALPLLVFIVIQWTPYDLYLHAPSIHFYIVSLVSGLALAVAAAVGVAANRIRNIKVSFLSLAYVSLAAIFILHGLSTPGFLMHHSSIAGSMSQLSVLLAAIWLWLCSVSADRSLIRWLSRRQIWLLPAWLLVLILFGIVVLGYPETADKLQLRGDWVKLVLTCAIAALNGWTIYRNMQTYLASRLPLQLAIVYSTGWMFIAQIIMVTGTIWLLSWWLYHLMLLASVIVMVGGIAREFFSRGTLTASIRQLFRANPQDWIHIYVTPGVKKLVMETESRDAYTAGHNYRVAIYALKLGEEMGLSNAQLKAIVQGGLVHDIGKLHIPDVILNKPGRLTEEERKVIETHPGAGYDMCKRIGFMQDELAVIRSHHEKWDGTGYPDQLAGEAIPIVARVAAVADVYDALTSSRSYRKAMSHEKAMEILLEESGSHFDPRCIAAWERLVAEQKDFFLETQSNDPQFKLANNLAK